MTNTTNTRQDLIHRLDAARKAARYLGVPARRLVSEASSAVRGNRPSLAARILDRFEASYGVYL